MRKFLSFLMISLMAVGLSAKTLYLAPNDGWKSDNARFAVYAFSSETENAWYGMTAVEGEDGIYQAAVDDSYSSVIFCRMNPAEADNIWANKWNQTQDMLIQADKDMCNITDWNAGEWAVYTPAGQGGDEDQMYVWNGIGVTSADDATELGGAAEAVQESGTNIAVGVAQKGNWCLKANKGFSNGAYYLGFAMTNGVNAGDTVKIAYFRTTANSTYVLGMDFSADKASAATTYQILSQGDPQVLASNGTPVDSFFIVPEGVENATYMRIYRNSGSTGLWVAKVEIVKAVAQEPVVETPKFYITGNAALVGADKEWNPAAIASMEDSKVLTLAAGSYMMKITMNGTWEGENNVKGYDALTGDIPAGVTRGEGGDNDNICFTLAEAGDVTVTYTAESFTIAGNFYVPSEPTYDLTNGYYLVGNQYNWAPAAARLFVANPDNEAEFVLAGVELAEDDSIKVVSVENDAIVAWFPAEAGNYVVDAAHAGEKDIYFRPDYQGGEDWYAGCIYIAANAEPQPDPENLWKVTEETAVDAGTVYLDNNLLKLQTVYAGTLVPNERSFGLFTSTHAIQVRVDAWPTAENVTGTEKTGSTPLVVTAKENATITLYYNRQAKDGAFVDNDSKDIAVYDQADITKLDGVLTVIEENEDHTYAKVSKKVELVKDHIYTVCAKGTTVQMHGVVYEVAEPTYELTNGYYLVGNQYNWAPAAARLFVANPDNEAEFVLAGVELAEDDSIKVVSVENDAIVAWFPAEAGNYVVDAAHAGEKDIYFRPDYQGGEDWYAGCIYIAANAEPQPDPENLWKVTEETSVDAGTVYLDNNLLKLQTVYAGTLVPNERSFGLFTSTHAIQVRVDAWPTAENVTGTEKTGSTPLVVTAKENATITLYYNRQAKDGAFVDNDSKDIAVYDQADITKLDGVLTVIEENEDHTYAKVSKKVELLKDHVYTVCAKGTTVQMHGVVYEAAEPTYELTNGYYLVGNQYNWAPAAARLFVANPDNEAEFVLAGVELAEDDSIKVVSVENDAIVAWFPAEAGNYVVDAAHAGEKDIYFRPDYQGGEDWYAGCIYIAANPAPFECDWENLPFLGDGSPEQTFGNQFKLCKEGEYPGVVNIQKPDFAEESGIYVTFPSAAFGEISLAEGQYAIQGAGMILYCSAFVDEYTEVTVVCDNTPIEFTVYNAAAAAQPQLANGYYLVGTMNNWTPVADNLFVLNTEAAEGVEEYQLAINLAENDAIKVVAVNNDAITTWYPEGDNYVVDANHAGATIMYFRPVRNGEWGAFGGYFYIVPTGHVDIVNIDANATAQKILRDGQILIIKGNKTFNAQGQLVK